MPVQSISMNNVAFRGEVTKKDKTPVLNTEKSTDNKGINKKKLALALGGLATIGIAAVCIAKGKNVPSSELDIDKFKEMGKFDKGFATIKGKPYTGIITAANKNGNFSIQYKDGVLKEVLQTKASVPDGAIAKIAPQDFDGVKALGLKKVYSYDDTGKLKEVARYRVHLADDKNVAAGIKDGPLNLVKDSVTLLNDREVVIKKASSDFEHIETLKTVFDEEGKMSERVKASQKLGKDKVVEILNANSDSYLKI